MPEPRDECRPVTLPSGETIRVRGSDEMSPQAVEALAELVDAARTRHALEHPENPAAAALWARLEARAGHRRLRLREAAAEAGVRFSTLFRVAQGYMPDEGELARIERWLIARESPAP